MRTQKITLSFSRYTDADFLTKTQFILDSMTGNSYFTDPIPTLADVKTAITNYSDALTAAASKDRILVAEKNKSRTALEQLLYQLGMYVMYVANGDAAILASSGYTLAKEPEPQRLENPGLVTLSNGITSGQLVASVKPPTGTMYFIYQIAEELPNDNTTWTSSTSSRSQLVFENLKPGKQYWVRVAVTGRDRQIAYSPVSTQFSQ